MIFIGVDTAQVNTGFSVVSDKGDALFSTNLGREMPEGSTGKDVPDFIKNAAQRALFVKYFEEYSKDSEVGMVLFEGPDYGSSNITQISIGTIHGILWDYCMQHKINFAIVTPRSVNYAVFGTAKDITKRDTINAMKERHPNIKIRDSNMADSLAMAGLGRKFWYCLQGGEVSLTKGEQEVLLSKRKEKGTPKGLIYKRNIKYMVFDKEE